MFETYLGLPVARYPGIARGFIDEDRWRRLQLGFSDENSTRNRFHTESFQGEKQVFAALPSSDSKACLTSESPMCQSPLRIAVVNYCQMLSNFSFLFLLSRN